MANPKLKIFTSMTWKTQFVIVILLTLISKNRVEGTCEYPPCGNDPHTMCRYPEKLDKSVKECAGEKATAGLSQEFRKIILDRHNELRQQIAQGKAKGQPPAANMMKLYWNTELETIAQRFVNSCPKVGHDTCRNMKDGSYVGQNSASNAYPNKEPDRMKAVKTACELWFSEIDFMNGSSVADFSKLDYMKVGHFTQLAWAESEKLGCGYLEYTPDENFQYILLDCNYNPAGNVNGTFPVYIEGPACSKCPEGARCSTRYPGLCTKEEDENNDIPKAEGISIYGSTPWRLLLLGVFICLRNAV